MPVKREASGRRSVTLELEVEGTPEQVWEAVATGPGISSWFVPAKVEEREGGAMNFDFGSMGSSPATVTRWDPPRVFAYEEREWLPGAPPVATELTVETRGGGTCIVRMVHSLFTSDESWDKQLEGFESGWPTFFEVLKQRLSRFAGQPFAAVRASRAITGSIEDVWTALAADLGLAGAADGQRVQSRGDAPPLAGVVRRLWHGTHHEALIELERPASGFGLFSAYSWGGNGSASMTLYLFGADAAQAAAEEEFGWRSWLASRVEAVPAQEV